MSLRCRLFVHSYTYVRVPKRVSQFHSISNSSPQSILHSPVSSFFFPGLSHSPSLAEIYHSVWVGFLSIFVCLWPVPYNTTQGHAHGSRHWFKFNPCHWNWIAISGHRPQASCLPFPFFFFQIPPLCSCKKLESFFRFFLLSNSSWSITVYLVLISLVFSPTFCCLIAALSVLRFSTETWKEDDYPSL